MYEMYEQNIFNITHLWFIMINRNAVDKLNIIIWNYKCFFACLIPLYTITLFDIFNAPALTDGFL